ncbi:nucleoprotein [Armigeres subalbatus rhabdovirus]|nr:nucleoprotein [Armigeres subalbatus rhabdovirus]
MAQYTPQELARLMAACQLGRDFVDPMKDAIAKLNTGGLSAAQVQEIDADDGEDIVVRGIGDNPVRELILSKGIIPTYPLEYFEANNWTKPIVTLPMARPNAAIVGYYTHIRTAIRRDAPSIGSVLAFIELICAMITDTLRFDWVSLGVAIGVADQVISPLSLLTIARTSSAPQIGEHSNNITFDETIDLAMLILGGFRVHHATNQIYIDKLRDALKNQLTTPVLRDSIEVAIVNLAAVYADTEFVKLLCAIDMFFAMFPKHRLTKLRFGTLILSYKDCTGVAAIGHGCELMSHSTRIFTRWLMTPTLRQDFNRMNVPGQEITLPYSYGPYLAGLGLVDKSPYSAALNSGLHMFSHLIGCAVLSTRSINAIFFQPSGLSAIIDNVILFIYAHSCTSSLQLQFFKRTEIAEVKKVEDEARRQIEQLRQQLRTLASEETESEGGELDEENPEGEAVEDQGAGDLNNVDDAGDFDDLYSEEPRSRNAIDWYTYIFKHCRGAIPERMRAVVYDRWAQIKDVRPGTVGEFAKRMGRVQTH